MMDISLERSTIITNRLVYKDTLYCEISADYVVPDTQDDIQKLLKTNAQVRLKSKDTSQNLVHIGGEVCGELLYLTENGGEIAVLNFAVPFESEAHTQNVDAACFANGEIKLSAIDARAANPRKVNIRAEVLILVSCFKEDEVGFSMSVVEKYDKLFYKCATAKLLHPMFVGEKQISLDEEFSLDNATEGDALLSAKSEYSVLSAERVGKKLIVKGNAFVSVLLSEPDGKLREQQFETSFSQLFEMPSDSELYRYDACILPSAENYSLEDSLIKADLHAVIQLICYTQNEVTYIEDAYFCGKTPTLEREESDILTEICIDEKSTTSVLTFEDESMIRSVICLDSKVGKLKLSDEKVISAVCVDVLYLNENEELCCARVRGEMMFQAVGEGTFDVQIKGANATVSGKAMEITVTAVLFNRSYSVERISAVTAISIDENEEITPSATLYMCRRGERELWQIAKHYGSSEELIKSVNKIDDAKEADPLQMLLIPTL